MITDTQRSFILCFILDGEFDLHRACTQLGLRPSVANAWFRDKGFQAALKQAHAAKLNARGYGALLTMEDTLSIAHGDIGNVRLGEGEGLEDLPRHIRISIKSVKFKTGIKADGAVFTYIAEVVMRDNAWALQKAAEWFQVAEVVKNGGITVDDKAKRLAGIVVRPPITREDSEAEDLLRL